MALQPTESSVRYAAETKLLDIAYETAQTKNLSKVQAELQQGYNIFYWVSALDFSEFLEQSEVEKIWLCLIEIAQVYDFPIAPEINNQETPVVIGGSNTVINNNYYSNGVTFQNSDIDQPSEIVDTIPVTDDYGAVWFYTLRNGSNQRSGVFQASWLQDGSSIVYQEDSTSDIGVTTGVTLSATYSAGNIRLVVSTTSDNWIISGTRYQING